MSSKCLEFDCQYNKPKRQTKSSRLRKSERKSGGHSKIGRRQSVQTSGRCMLGAFKRQELCKIEEEILDG